MSRARGFFSRIEGRARAADQPLQAIDFEPQGEHLSEQLGRRVELEARLARISAFAAELARSTPSTAERYAHGRRDARRRASVERGSLGRAHQARRHESSSSPRGKSGTAFRAVSATIAGKPSEHVGWAGERAAAASARLSPQRSVTRSKPVSARIRRAAPSSSACPRLPASPAARPPTVPNSRRNGPAAGHGFEDDAAFAELEGDVEQIGIVGQADP